VKQTRIRWTDATWNPISGCRKISPGCDNCYAEAIATSSRFATGFPQGFEPTFKPHKLDEPRRMAQPSRIFVNSMSDMFLGAWSNEQVDQMLDAMAKTDRHDYMVLTKRPAAMHRHITRWLDERGLDRVPSHIWLGVSVENQEWADKRIPLLVDMPVDVRFLSCEPLVGPVDLSPWVDSLQWVIVGGESGNGSKNFRPMPHEWARSIRDLCVDHGVPFFFKQSAGIRTETGIEFDGRQWEQWPAKHPRERAMGMDGAA